MSRLAKNSAVVLLVAFVAVAMAPSLSSGQDGQGALLPPNANFRGTSFADWNTLALEWEIATGLGGQVLPDTIKDVRFLPGNFAGDEFDIQIGPGTAIAFPAWPVFGEMYDDGTQDDPNDPIIAFLYTVTTIESQLDGTVLLQGLASDLDSYSFGPVVLDEPIYYAEPQPRGPGLNAIAATFVFGIGSVYHPLPVGEHTLVIDVQDPILGNFHTTYHITVSPQ
jgi:hypothetical protein